MNTIYQLTFLAIALSTLSTTQLIQITQNHNSQTDESRQNNKLFKAIINYNEPEAIRALENGANINTQNLSYIYKHTPLHLAVIMGHNALVDTLIRHKANSNIQNADGSTPLMLAVTSNYPSSYIIREIILAGADLEIKDHQNKTALEQIKTDSVRTVFLNAIEERNIYKKNTLTILKAHL